MKSDSTTGLTTGSIGAAFNRQRAGPGCGVTRSVTSASELSTPAGSALTRQSGSKVMTMGLMFIVLRMISLLLKD